MTLSKAAKEKGTGRGRSCVAVGSLPSPYRLQLPPQGSAQGSAHLWPF